MKIMPRNFLIFSIIGKISEFQKMLQDNGIRIAKVSFGKNTY
jgi:hypothetical protein